MRVDNVDALKFEATIRGIIDDRSFSDNRRKLANRLISHRIKTVGRKNIDVPGHIQSGHVLPVQETLDFVGPAPTPVDVAQGDVVPFSGLQFVFDAQLVTFARFGFKARHDQTIADEMATVA
uniref:Uncharacterized protein n=1 Tax=Romanomermis culicivorax TaxID=13658 RepID=A0A915KAM3_ROMCU